MINKRKKKLQDDRAKAFTELKEYKAGILAEERELTDEELTKCEEMVAKVEKLDTLIAQEEAEEKLARADTHIVTPDGTPPGENESNVTVKNRIKPFETIGEQLLAIQNAYQPGAEVHEGLQEIQAASGLEEGVGSAGGFLVQVDLATELLKRQYTTGLLTSRVRRIPIGPNSDGIKVKKIVESSRASSTWGGLVIYRVTEAGTKTASSPNFGLFELSLIDSIGLYYATDNLLQDATALTGILTEGFTEAFDLHMSDEIINGTGAGQALGLINAGCTVSVAKEVGQAADTIVADNLYKMYARLWARGISRAVWLVNQDCMPQIFRLNQAVGTGGAPLFYPPGGISQAPFGTLLGRPILPVEPCATVGDTGDIIFTDLSNFIMIDKGGIKTDTSIHVEFLTNQTAFRFVYRWNGAPWQTTALTPKKGSNTQSPIIKLDERA